MRSIAQQRSVTVALVVVNAYLAAACAQRDLPTGSLTYYRTHPAQWERAVWVCTNDDSAFASTIGCVNALAVLNEADIGKAHGGLPEASASSASQSTSGD